jgi:glycosyltransferase involved in cell wall biosynthesis
MRLLVSNVFFPPQSIGGATRVVRDNIADFVSSGAFEAISVFCSVEGGGDSGRVYPYHHSGTEVCAVTTRPGADADFRLHDAAVSARFKNYLEYFQPDIIHFHCIQRLTSDIVAIAKSSGVPYVITMHDGWWISDRQFLINEAGEIELYDYTNIDLTRYRFGQAAVERQQTLLPLLEGAGQLLTVSDTFRNVIASASVKEVEVIGNGVSPISSLPKTQNERVVLGYLAGLAHYKGYEHLRAAFERGDYANIEVVIVDHSLREGETVLESWGGSHVERIGFIPQDKVAELYARLNVVAMPSIWPESYGLVAREALLSECWVIASSRGAASEDIVEGRNGHVFDATDRADFDRVLADINANPATYLAPPDPVELRSSRHQAAELIETYSNLLAHSSQYPSEQRS